MSDAFDPDAFLAKRAAPRAAEDFDPEAFLSGRGAASGPPQVGMGETFINRAVNAMPGGKASTDSVAALLLKAFGTGAGVGLTSQAQTDLRSRGMDVPQAYQPRTLMDLYRGARDRRLLRTEAGSQQNPWTGRAGTSLGLLLTGMAPGVPAFGALGEGMMLGKMLPAALTGAGYGAEAGLEHGSADLTRGEFGKAAFETALSTLLGGGLGGILGAGAEGVTRAAPKVAGVLERFADRKALNALGASKPQLNKLGSETAGELGRFARDEGVVTSMAGRPAMAERAAQGIKTEGRDISQALSTADAAANPEDLIKPADAAAKVRELAAKLRKTPALTSIAEKFEREAENILKAGGDTPLSLSKFEELVARPYKRTTNWNENISFPKETLQQLPMSLEQMVEQRAGDISRRTGIDIASKYGAAKSRYGNFVDLADLAEEGLRKNFNHSVGLKDALLAILGSTMGYGHGATLTGLLGAGALGGSKLLGHFGDQWAAAGAGALGNALRGSSPTGAGSAARLADLLAPSVFSPRQPQPRLMPSPAYAEAR